MTNTRTHRRGGLGAKNAARRRGGLRAAIAVVAGGVALTACDPHDPGCGPHDAPVLETELACEANDPSCVPHDAPVLEMGLADCNAGDPGCPDAPVVEMV